MLFTSFTVKTSVLSKWIMSDFINVPNNSIAIAIALSFIKGAPIKRFSYNSI